MPFTAPRGTQDILPADVRRWQWLEDIFLRLCARYGFRAPQAQDTLVRNDPGRPPHGVNPTGGHDDERDR